MSDEGPHAELAAGPATSPVLARVDRSAVELAYHDVACPEGADCRDRGLHAILNMLRALNIEVIQ